MNLKSLSSINWGFKTINHAVEINAQTKKNTELFYSKRELERNVWTSCTVYSEKYTME